MPGKNLSDQIQHVHAFGPAVPSSASPRWISLKNVDAIEVVIQVLNATTVTGSAVTLSQATAVAGTSAKTLAFTTYYSNVDPSANANTTKQTASSNTFTTLTTNSATAIYRIPIDPATLDVNNGFDCVRVALANATAATVSAHYNIVTSDGGNYTTMASVLVD